MAGVKDAKDVTSETFGLLIAYLLPGVVGFFSMSYWSSPVNDTLRTFSTEQANLNLLLLVILSCLAVGILVTALRGYIFEKCFPSVNPLTDEEFFSLSDPNTFAAFRALVDAHYRYHQCWGSIAIILPILYVGWMKHKYGDIQFIYSLGTTILFVVFEATVFWAARDAYKKYVGRARKILENQKEEKANG